MFALVNECLLQETTRKATDVILAFAWRHLLISDFKAMINCVRVYANYWLQRSINDFSLIRISEVNDVIHWRLRALVFRIVIDAIRQLTTQVWYLIVCILGVPLLLPSAVFWGLLVTFSVPTFPLSFRSDFVRGTFRKCIYVNPGSMTSIANYVFSSI